MIDIREPKSGAKRRFRMIIPAYPAFNIYSKIAKHTTALGPIFVATVVSKIPGWEVEIIDENNYWPIGPVDKDGLPDHETLQRLHPADMVGLYGGLSSTAPRIFKLARWYNDAGAVVVAGGQHFADEANIREAIDNGVHYVVIGEGEETIAELIQAIEHRGDLKSVKGISFLSEGLPMAGFERTALWFTFSRFLCLNGLSHLVKMNSLFLTTSFKFVSIFKQTCL